MKYLVTFSLIFFLSIFKIIAQSDFREGYIIKNNNDTVFGLINYKGNKANAKLCIFKLRDNSDNQGFTPDEIKAYRFMGSKYYISKPVVTDNETQQIFLEYLINGIVDVFYYRDTRGEHYLVDKGAGNLYELKNEEKEIIVNNTQYIQESKEYIGLLRLFFSDSPEISKRVDDITLDHKSLINVAHDYHNEVCTDEECIIYEKKLPRIKSTYGIVIGASGMSVSQAGEFIGELYYMNDSQFGFGIFPSVGLYYKVNMPFINERLFFQYEGTYSRMELKTSNSYVEPTYNMTYLNDIELVQNTFNNFFFVKYEFPKGMVKPTFQVGGFVKYFFKTDYDRDLEVQYSWGDTYYTKQINDSPFQQYDIGINLGFGLTGSYLNGKEVFLDFRYQRGFGLLEKLNTNTYSVNIGFQIGK